MIRDANPADHVFIEDAWVSSAKPSIPRRYVRAYVHDLLSGDYRTKLLVACSNVDPTILYGFACEASGRLMYVFVKSDWRRKGIASDLLGVLGFKPGEPYRYAESTRTWRAVIRTSTRWGRGRQS